MTSPAFFRLTEFGAFDFAIDLRERFLAAHGQDGVTERDKDGDDAEHVRQRTVRQPAKRRGSRDAGCSDKETAGATGGER